LEVLEVLESQKFWTVTIVKEADELVGGSLAD
jgi:hypothetical protein